MTFYSTEAANNSLTQFSNLPLGVTEMKQTASFSLTSIKSSQAYDTCRRQIAPSLLPLNGAVSPFSLHNGMQLSIQHKHQIYTGSLNLLSFLDRPTPLFCIPSPSLFQHLCWVHAQASDKALCVPNPGNPPHFSPSGFLPHHPGNLTTVCPSFSAILPTKLLKGRR